MKKILVVLMVLILGALASCGSVEEALPDWEDALVEYLAQFLPIFHDVGRVASRWWPFMWWESAWEEFVYRFVEWGTDEFWEMLDRGDLGYEHEYIFQNSMTGERIFAPDVPYLRWNGFRNEIAIGFNLFDLNDRGVPYLVVYWDSPYNDPFQSATLHRFRDGNFEFVKELASGSWVSFYRGDDGGVFIDFMSTVAHMLDFRLMHLGDEIIITPVLSTDGWTGALYNHLTGEEVLRNEDDGNWGELTSENRREGMLGMEFERIEPREDLRRQFTEIVSERLRREGLVR